MSEISTFVIVMAVGAIVLIAVLVFVYRLIVIPMDASDATEPRTGEPVAILDGLGEMEAEILRSKLATAGIPAFKRNSHIAPTIEYIPPFGWEVRVRYADRFEAARWLGIALPEELEMGDASMEDAPDVDYSSRL